MMAKPIKRAVLGSLATSAIALIAVAAICLRLRREAIQPQTMSGPTVDVSLLAPIEKVQGIRWPRLDNGQPDILAMVQSPRIVVIHLPGGQTFASPSRVLSIDNDDGIVTAVTVMPLQAPEPYTEVVTAAEALLTKLGVPANDPGLLKLQAYKVSEDLQPTEEINARADLNKGASIFISIWPTADGSTWAFSAIFCKSAQF